jgi:hypothetical protein
MPSERDDVPGTSAEPIVCERLEPGGYTRTGDPLLPEWRGAAVSLPHLPPGARFLAVDEAVELLVTGDHPEAGGGSVALDSALIAGLRDGLIVACLLPDGRIAFTRPSANPDQ